ncbi:MAG: hypothetical protein C5B50_24135 [Verrucomicrobia bacterium]|nr:MAG: hypothetical protein C5B50_24135 [Verrucomicrobiota bacterium]
MDQPNFMKTSNDSSKDDGLGFDLPDWSGMADSGLKVDPSLAVQLCEEHYARLPEKARRYLQEMRCKRNYVEFSL